MTHHPRRYSSGLSHALNDELRSVVVDFDVAQLSVSAHTSEQSGFVVNDSGADLVGLSLQLGPNWAVWLRFLAIGTTHGQQQNPSVVLIKTIPKDLDSPHS